MSDSETMNIAVIPGDGIGVEVTKTALDVLNRAQSILGGFSFRFDEAPAGAACYRDTGEAIPKETLDAAEKGDAILLGACGLPDIRYPDGTEIRPQVELRFIFDLYAGVRPIRFFPGIPLVLADKKSESTDFVLVRESTEGLFASRGSGKNPEVATETMVITRRGSERLMRFSYELARSRKAKGYPGRLTCVDKANVFSAFAFFRDIYDRIGDEFPDIERDYCYVDAMALNLVRKPWDYDVLVMENIFGDILSDQAAGLIGGMGMAPSADIGDEHAIFQPSHGSAPDIAGKGIANPVAMILSAAMMCDYLGRKFENEKLAQASTLIEKGVETYLAGSENLPCDQGGTAKTEEIAEGVIREMEKAGKK